MRWPHNPILMIVAGLAVAAVVVVALFTSGDAASTVAGPPVSLPPTAALGPTSGGAIPVHMLLQPAPDIYIGSVAPHGQRGACSTCHKIRATLSPTAPIL